MAATSDLYLRQIPIGPMANFVYLIGSRRTRECVIVDPAWNIDALLEIAAEDDMRVTGALVTHYHPDHCGGDMMGMSIEGVNELLEEVQVPVHVQADEAEYVLKVTDLDASDLVQHSSGDVVLVGEVDVELLHTPGHTPGSQCFFVDGRLIAGDTLFLQGCGRTDLPGGDPEALYESLTQRLAKVPDSAVLFPGHLYSPKPSDSMGEVRTSNMVFKPRSAEEWMRVFGS